jgi:hypothetical protein
MPRGSPKQRSAVPTPASRLGEWSEAEKEKLRELHTELGPEGEKAWNQLATQLPGRSGRAALKQWNKMIKRQAPRRHRTLGWEAVKMPAKGRHGLVRTKDGERFARQQNPRGKRSYAEVARRGSGQFISPTAQRRRGASSTQATPKPTPQCHRAAGRRLHYSLLGATKAAIHPRLDPDGKKLFNAACHNIWHVCDCADKLWAQHMMLMLRATHTAGLQR